MAVPPEAPQLPHGPDESPAANRRRIDLRLNDLNQLFHSLDPSPFREKDLDGQAEEFIVDWARELPRSAPLLLTIHLAKQPAMGGAAGMVRDAVRNYFSYRAEHTRGQYRELLSQGWKNLAIGLVFLFACLVTADFLAGAGDGTFITVLRESLIIGGWVAMWRPMEIFLYDRWPLQRRYRLYRRLSAMEIHLQLGE